MCEEIAQWLNRNIDRIIAEYENPLDERIFGGIAAPTLSKFSIGSKSLADDVASFASSIAYAASGYGTISADGLAGLERSQVHVIAGPQGEYRNLFAYGFGTSQ